MRIYLDSTTIIYSLEGVPAVRDIVVRYIEWAEQSAGGAVITSQLARLECRVKPLRDRASSTLALVDAFFARPGIILVDVSTAILERAALLRAEHGFKTPDAIHLATASSVGPTSS
jgi:predicted nucleic acid-binding protein